MKETMFSQAAPEERLQMLQDNCDAAETLQYFKQESEETLTARRAKVAELAIQLADLEEERKTLLAELKEARKPVKEELAENLDAVRLNGVKVKEQVYKFVDQEEGMVGYYDAQGQLVQSRRILPEERQTTIHRAINS